jgi:hypothetical protein
MMQGEDILKPSRDKHQKSKRTWNTRGKEIDMSDLSMSVLAMWGGVRHSILLG